jgi:hydrogenase maturation protease
VTRFLVIGYGNELRGDDAAGPRMARRLARRRSDADVRAVHQLTPDLAEALAAADVAVFVDASADGNGCVRLRRLIPREGSDLGHVSDPCRLLALAEAVCGRRPEAWLVTVPAAGFGLGEPLSAAARRGVAAAERLVLGLLRRAAREGP